MRTIGPDGRRAILRAAYLASPFADAAAGAGLLVLGAHSRNPALSRTADCAGAYALAEAVAVTTLYRAEESERERPLGLGGTVLGLAADRAVDAYNSLARKLAPENL